jgi:membrane dipeptidase
MLAVLAWLAVGFGASQEFALREHALALHEASPLVDGHNDLPWRLRVHGGLELDQADLRKLLPDAQTDIVRLRQGGLGAQFWSVWVPVSYAGSRALAATRQQIRVVYRLGRNYTDVFQVCWTSDEVMRAFRQGKIASLIGVEGGHCINDSLDALRDLYRVGARYMTLTHSRNTSWADSATDRPQHGGLTAFGRSVVREMQRLGMLVDLSHVSVETMHDALDVAKAPVIFSHSGARAVCDHPRNVPDDVLIRLKTNGGVVMVIFVDEYVSQDVANWESRRRQEEQRLRVEGKDASEVRSAIQNWISENPRPVATVQQVADHIDHIRRVAGVDHVGVGSDFDGGGGVLGLEDVSKFPNLTVELLRRGYKDHEIVKILGLNVLRVMKEAERFAERYKNQSKNGLEVHQEQPDRAAADSIHRASPMFASGAFARQGCHADHERHVANGQKVFGQHRP